MSFAFHAHCIGAIYFGVVEGKDEKDAENQILTYLKGQGYTMASIKLLPIQYSRGIQAEKA